MEQHGPWKIKDKEIKYQNPWIMVTEHQVVRPDGKPGIYGTVGIKPGISVLPMDKKGIVYLTNEFHFALGARSIQAVSGAVDKGETPLQAAKRELKEELGIEAGVWTNLGTINPFTAVVHSPAQLFLAKQLTFGEKRWEGTEDIPLVKMPFKGAVDKVLQSEITHGPSALLILKAHLHSKTQSMFGSCKGLKPWTKADRGTSKYD